ncbi:MAG: DMT family transporter, partial [Aggregatilineales bacterium]
MLLRGAIYGISAATIWGGMYVVSDIVLEVIPPFTLLTIRLLLAIGLLIVILHLSGRTLPEHKLIIRFLGVGLVGMGVSLGAQFAGTALSTAVNGALVTSASPVFIMLFAVLILHEKLISRRIVAGILAIIGVLVILNPAQADFGSETFLGDIFLIIAAITWGLYSVLVRWAGQGEKADTLMITAIASIGGLFVSVPAAAIELTQNNIGVIDIGTLLGILYLGFVS